MATDPSLPNEMAASSDQPSPPPHAASPTANPRETPSAAATAVTSPPTNSNKKAESVKSFSSTTSSSHYSASSSSHTAIQVDGAKASQQAHALPVKDFVYKVPAPLPDNHPSKLAAKRQQRRCTPCMCRLICIGSILLTAILLLAIGILLFYVIAQPRLPKIDIEALTATEFNITGGSVKSGAPKYTGYINAAMVMRVRMRNMNKKMGVRYEDVKGEVWYEGVMISQASMGASGNILHQSARNTTSLQIRMSAEKVGLDKKVTDSTKKSLAANGSLTIHVSTSANVALQLGAWKSRQVPLQAACSASIAIGTTAVAKSALIPKSCVASQTKLPFVLLFPSK
ncbi:hypothetical protein L7F22_035268 [Adiantum nelumboides]|nr:hypothetical protein [Adiantum nelumboides]